MALAWRWSLPPASPAGAAAEEGPAPLARSYFPRAGAGSGPPPARTATPERIAAAQGVFDGPASVRRVFAANREDVQDCYDVATQDGRVMEGRMTMTFELAGGGTVSSVDAVSTLPERGERMERCIAALARSWRFPPTDGGAPVQFIHTFSFQGR
jgi:hypothetical protein